MILQPKGNRDPKERFHVPSGVGKALILAGLVEEYLPHDKLLARIWVPLQWMVARENELTSSMPCIRVTCAMCGKSELRVSKTGQAHKQPAFSCLHHSHVQIPADVAARYERVWAAYERHFTAAPRKKFYGSDK